MARQKGEGYIFKRGKFFYLQFDVAGKRKIISLKTTERREADAKADELLKPAVNARDKEEVLLHAARARKLVTTSSINLVNVWNEYLKHSSRPDSSPGTLGNYERHWNNFIDWLKEVHPEIVKLSQITPETARKYAAYLWEEKDRKITANTFNYHMKSLALITRILKGKAGLDVNSWTADNISRKTELKQRRKEFSREQVNQIFDSFQNETLHLMHKPEMEVLFKIAAFTGLRLVDAVLLKWDSIDLVRNIISLVPVKTRKTGRRVNIPLHPILKNILEFAGSWKDESGYVLPKVAGRYNINPDGLKSDCIRILEFNGFKERGEGRGRARRFYGFHSFRHFFASTCADAGVPAATLAEILGDNIQTLNKYYVHAQEESRVKMLHALDNGTKQLAVSGVEPEREKLIKLAQSVNIQAIRRILKVLESER